MPNLSGKWTQTQILSAGIGWYKSPGVPSSISATTSENSSIAIGAPTDLGIPAEITGYTATASTGGTVVQTVTGASSPLTFSGLSDGVTYTISATASNLAGQGPPVTTSTTVVVPTGQQEYITAGTFSWVVPAGVASVCVVAVGGGGRNAGQGGGLQYGNGISVTPGATITVVAGAGGLTQQGSSPNADGKNSTFGSNITAAGGAGDWGDYSSANSVTGASSSGGGNGGLGQHGGGGAGGYSGAGGQGSFNVNSLGTGGTGGGGGGGGTTGHNGTTTTGPGGGGGVGIMGEGASGAVGGTNAGGGGGSGGTAGGTGYADGAPNYDTNAGTAGVYGGAVGTNSSTPPAGPGGHGAVRIIWGSNRAFPTTNTGNL